MFTNKNPIVYLLTSNNIKYKIICEPNYGKYILYVPSLKLQIHKFHFNRNYYIYVNGKFLKEIQQSFFTNFLVLRLNMIIKLLKQSDQWDNLCENLNMIELLDKLFELYGPQIIEVPSEIKEEYKSFKISQNEEKMDYFLYSVF
jgi:hypothetical protein